MDKEWSVSIKFMSEITGIMDAALKVINEADAKDGLIPMRGIVTNLTMSVSRWAGALYADVYLNVPWVSQVGDDAALASGDCGAACASMISAFYHPTNAYRSPDWFTTKMGTVFRYATVRDIMEVLRVVDGLQSRVYGEYNHIMLTEDTIEKALDEGHPVIALVDYEIVNPGDSFDGLHWIVISGYTNSEYHILDPLPVDIHEGMVYVGKSTIIAALNNTPNKGAQAGHGLVVYR